MFWFTSDHHFGHARICELAGRPYDNVDDMNADLIARHNSIVSPTDTVVFLGDVAMGRIADSLPLVAEMNGNKILVPGNHDRIHPVYGTNPNRMAEWTAKYEAVGFTIVDDGGLDIPGNSFTVSHFPYTGDHADDDRHPEFRPVDDGGWLLHGHTHGMWRKNGRMFDVGVDAWSGFPVSLDVLDDVRRAAGPDMWMARRPWTTVC